MYSNILLTIDLNDPASWEHALPKAVALTRVSQGKLHLLAVVPDLGMPIVAEFFPDDMRHKALQRAATALNEIAATHLPGDLPFEEHLAYGIVHEEILACVAKCSADLVVMGSHAPEPIREFLVGSQADRVVRRSPVSVLVVRA